MKRAIFVRMKRLSMVFTALALGACTGSDTREPELPDSALTQVPADPAAAPQPIQPESLTRAPSQAPATSQTPAQRAPATSTKRTGTESGVKQPPPARDTRPSIPYPPDTL